MSGHYRGRRSYHGLYRPPQGEWGSSHYSHRRHGEGPPRHSSNYRRNLDYDPMRGGNNRATGGYLRYEDDAGMGRGYNPERRMTTRPRRPTRQDPRSPTRQVNLVTRPRSPTRQVNLVTRPRSPARRSPDVQNEVATVERRASPIRNEVREEQVPMRSRSFESRAPASAEGPNREAQLSPIIAKRPAPNDCEIILMDKAHQLYAEMIEEKLIGCGLEVDLLFPKEGINLKQFLKSMSKVDHKNVPLERAFDVIMEIYKMVKLQEVGPVPDNIKTMLRKVAADELIKDEDYSALLDFLAERKVKLFPNRPTKSVNEPGEPERDINKILDSKEGKELQAEIMAILNEKKENRK